MKYYSIEIEGISQKSSYQMQVVGENKGNISLLQFIAVIIQDQDSTAFCNYQNLDFFMPVAGDPFLSTGIA